MKLWRGQGFGRWIWCLLAPSALVWAASGDVPVGAGSELKIKPPLPVWPSDYETTARRRPIFRFCGRYGATRYRVELARDPGFGSPLTIEDTQPVEQDGIDPVFHAPWKADPLSNGQYYWRVFAADNTGTWTPPANYRTFFVADQDVDAIAVSRNLAHPRLLLTAGELPGFRARVERSGRLGPGWQYIQNAAYSMLDAAPPNEDYARAAKGQHGNYSIIAHWYLRHLSNTAFTAFVTGDEKLAAKGVEILMAACAYERWLGPTFEDRAQFDPPWHSALETAMMTTAVATGYDLLYPRLTNEQRARVRTALAEKGIRPLVRDWADPVTASRLPRHQLPTGNWVMVCSSGAGVGALALLGEEPDAADWVRLVRNRTRAWLHDRGGDWFVDNPWVSGRPTPIPVVGPSEANFDADGAYKESTTYMNYAMQYVCCFADGLRRTTGENLFQHFPHNLLDQTAWTLMAWRERGEVRSSLMPFGDCGTTAAFPMLYAALTRHTRDPLAAWLCARVVPVPQDIRELVWLDESVPADAPDTSVPMRAFRGVGQVAMRAGWGPDTTAAAIKFRQNRGHLDLGTFYLFGRGQPTLVDSGSGAYGSAVYNQYLSQTIAHNVVMIDNRPQARADGTLLAAIGTSRIAAASGQLASAYPDALRSWTRDMVMLPGGLAVVLDRLEADQPHRFDYVLHPYSPFQSPFPNASPGELLIGDIEKPTRIRLNSEAAFTARETDEVAAATSVGTQPASDATLRAPHKYLRFESPEPARTRTYLLTCEWPTPSATTRPFDVSSTGPGRWQVRRVSQDWRLLIRTGADADVNNSTDARLVAVWDEGEKSRERHAIVLGGRRLGVDSRELMGATRPVHAAIEFGRPLYAHVWASEPTRLNLNVEPGADYVFLNGVPADTQRRGNDVLIDLPAGESFLVASETSRYIPRPRSVVFDDLLAVPAAVNAPAFQPGVVVRSSSCVPEGLQAIDGDANTGWASLQGLPMPQWLEVTLPAEQTIRSIRLESGGPCKGRVETWDGARKDYVLRGEFATTAETPSAKLTFEPVQTDHVRLIVTEIAPSANTASIQILDWE